MNWNLLHLCKKRNASSYSTSLVVDGPRLIVGSATIEMTNANVFLRSKGERRERSCKVEQRKWENIAKVSGRDERGELSDGRKRDQERRDKGRSRRGRAVNDYYLIRSAVSEGDGTIN